MNKLLAAAVLGLGAWALAPAAQADEARDGVVSCLRAMGGTGPTWDQCRAQMFAACATDQVGTPDHIDCLQKEVDGWEVFLLARRDDLVPLLKTGSAVQLTDLMGHWRSYVANQCGAVAAANPGAPEAARLGCTISEFAGLATELSNCAQGRSGEDYCVMKE